MSLFWRQTVEQSTIGTLCVFVWMLVCVYRYSHVCSLGLETVFPDVAVTFDLCVGSEKETHHHSVCWFLLTNHIKVLGVCKMKLRPI